MTDVVLLSVACALGLAAVALTWLRYRDIRPVMKARSQLEAKAFDIALLASEQLRFPLVVIATYRALFDEGDIHPEAIKHVLPIIDREFGNVARLLDELAATAKKTTGGN